LTSDKIFLRGIQFYAYGGVTSEEKKVGQRYSVDLDIVVDLSRAAVTDDLRDTVSYAEAFNIVVSTAQREPFNLLESVASRIAQALLEKLPIQGVTIKLQKLVPPIEGIISAAGVEITVEAPD
jgi:7,8-dihydroneopterin aldolase/epimerase/oxygenase